MNNWHQKVQRYIVQKQWSQNRNGGKKREMGKVSRGSHSKDIELYNKEIILSMTQNMKEEVQTSNGGNTKGDMNFKNITMITSPDKKWKLNKERNTWFVRDDGNIQINLWTSNGCNIICTTAQY